MANNYFKLPKIVFTKKVVVSTLLTIFALQTVVFASFYIAKMDPFQKLRKASIASITNITDFNGALKPKAPQPIFGIYSDSSIGSLQKPMAVTVYRRKIFVSDTNNHRIAVFDYDGKPLYTFGKDGTGQGEFKFPYGITADSSGQIYVADLYNGKISIFDQTGKFIKYFAQDEKNIFDGPAGLYFFDNQIFVTDVQQHKVMVFNLAGKKILEFGKKGNGNGDLSSPNAVTATNEFIYVSDTGNNRVVKFDRNGKFLATITGGNSEQQDSGVVNVRGIAVDDRGILFVVSNLTNKVWSFDKNGQLAFDPIGELGSENNQFTQPNGMFIDAQGRIYIADSLNQRIMVYQN